ncbi:UDP-N-acetylmuramoyl-L-alanine--D-glutamate ligase [Rhodohalobacter sp. SW132]|uniref:UDP-N-acetylmuramoyl-L-alanine--D-glutamate ligase n=1 Tax=Rhodohalobacter sp. SW132 TaxID=2293433 RepID=UPI000E274CC5|nr:UDP-N-acetylmuramoyl-L-alanine--D-glutamate ligase [Rhodohalobacter sp. SW132]REL24260.1 UDP-N-acetylmuramoyl-L-alanine--D-glutamate ligase [Rhodohalobacter sp. SW132]
MKDLKNRHIVVAGGARSGVAAALLLKRQGADVFLSDAGVIAEPMAERLRAEEIPFEQDGHTSRAEEGEFLIISPGIPTTAPIAQSYLNAGKKIYSEVELASWFNNGRTVAVTGSNGKTTVVNWLSHIWKTAGKPHYTAGNIGTAYSEVSGEPNPVKDTLLEISSFQLDHIESFRPNISMILNITPDHLDRYHNNFDLYAQSKFRITENQTADDWFIYDADDPVLAKFSHQLSQKETAPRMLAFSVEREVEQGIYLDGGQLILTFNQKKETFMDMNNVGLPGKHNLKNGMAAALAARACEIKNNLIRESIRSFEGVEHRLEPVRELDGVRYINDSKATNVNAVWYALDSYDMPVVLILGGRDKGNNYRELESQLREKVHTVIAMGEAREAIQSQLSSLVPNLVEANSMKEAVKLASKSAKRGEVVLLSPACSSFDMFENYEDRGRIFKQAVLDL